MSQASAARKWGPRVGFILAVIILFIVVVMGPRDISWKWAWDSTAGMGSELLVNSFYLLVAAISLTLKRSRVLAWVLMALVAVRMVLRLYVALEAASILPILGTDRDRQCRQILEYACVINHFWLLLMMVPLPGWRRTIPIVAGCLATLHWVDGTLVATGIYPGIPHWAYSLLGLLAGISAVTTAALIYRRIGKTAAVQGVSPQMQMTCPRCGLGQQVSLGETLCLGCRLRITLATEESRGP